jgi:hypothetical protein
MPSVVIVYSPSGAYQEARSVVILSGEAVLLLSLRRS